jgi:hypothetical protein
LGQPLTKISVVVIGDSFTQPLFAPYFTLRTARYAWVPIPIPGCPIDADIVRPHDPQIVILMPTERSIGC